MLQLAQGQARPARQREGKAWLQPELAGGPAGGGQAGWGPSCPLAASGSHPTRLHSLRLLSQLLPLQLLLNSQSKLLLPCQAVTGSEWPLPWTCLRFSSPCWSTLCLGQRRRQVGTEVACIGWPPRCRGTGAATGTAAGQISISKLERVPSRGLPLVPSWARGRAAVQREMRWAVPLQLRDCPLGLLAGGRYGQHVATDRCCAPVGQGQDQRTLLRECPGC